MGDPKIEIIYNVGGVTQKQAEDLAAKEQEEEKRRKMLDMKAKIEEKRQQVISKL